MKEPSDVNGAKEEDENNIQELPHTIGCEDVSVESITRLGSKAEEEEAKPQPIKLVLASEGQKVKVLGKSKNLRSQTDSRFATMFMHQDLTPLQSDRRRKLLQELKTRQEQGKENLITEELENCKSVGTPGSLTLASNPRSSTAKAFTGNLKTGNLTQPHTNVMKCEQDGLKCLYTNANSLINKIDELTYRAEEMDIIARSHENFKSSRVMRW